MKYLINKNPYSVIFFGIICIFALISCVPAKKISEIPTKAINTGVNTISTELNNKTITITEQPTLQSTEIPVYQFSNEILTVPDEILKEIAYHVTGGGVDCVCEKDYPSVAISDCTRDYPPIEKMEYISLTSCGWESNEVVELEVYLPNGSLIFKDEINASTLGYFLATETYQSSLEDPIGIYTYSFRGDSGTATGSFSVIQPNGPKVFYLKGNNPKQFLIYNFQPYEKFRIFYYEPISPYTTAELRSWKSFSTDVEGRAYVDIPNDGIFIVLGDSSGEYDYFGASSIVKTNLAESCPGAPKQQVETGKQAIVCTKKDAVYVRNQPSKNGEKIESIHPGTIVNVIKGPVCADNWSWWSVTLEDDTEGWIAEGGDSIDPYFICPVK